LSRSNDPSGRIPWIALLALVALLAGVGVWVSHWRAAQPAPVEPPVVATPADTTFEEPPDDAVDRALALAGDSTAIKQRWVEDIQGVDFADLDPERREIVIRFANARACTCGCGFTLAACRTYDPTCEISGPLAQTMVDSVRAGSLRDVRGLRPRPAKTAHSSG
jgi:hypothetical protein